MRPSDPEQDQVVRELRERITEADRAILEAANTRLRLVRELREHKIAQGWDFVDPGREERLLRSPASSAAARTRPGAPLQREVARRFGDMLFAGVRRSRHAARRSREVLGASRPANAVRQSLLSLSPRSRSRRA